MDIVTIMIVAISIIYNICVHHFYFHLSQSHGHIWTQLDILNDNTWSLIQFHHIKNSKCLEDVHCPGDPFENIMQWSPFC